MFFPHPGINPCVIILPAQELAIAVGEAHIDYPGFPVCHEAFRRRKVNAKNHGTPSKDTNWKYSPFAGRVDSPLIHPMAYTI
jgi:hypothetical protein